MAYPGGLGDASADIARYQRAVFDIDRAIVLARAKQPEAVPGLQDQRRRLLALIESLKPQAHADDSPSGIAVTISNVADYVRGLGGKIALAAGIGLALVIGLPFLTRRK